MKGERPPRRALLVEDTTAMRTLMVSALTTAGFEVVACATAREAIKKFDSVDPDVLIADIDLGERPNGVELATILRAKAPYLALVFVTNLSSTNAFSRTITPPTNYAFLQKNQLDSTERLIEVVESSLSDVLDTKILHGEHDENPLNELTAAQLEIVSLIASGLTNAEIAESRSSSLRAVERMVTRTFETLGLNVDSRRNPRVVVTNMYTRAFGYPVRSELQ